MAGKLTPTTYTPELIAEWRRNGWWNDKLLSDYLDDAVANDPTRIVAYQDDTSISAATLSESSRKLARSLLRDGVASGDRICVVLPQSIENIICLDALSRIGAIAMPMMMNVRSFELATEMQMTEADGAIVWGADWRGATFPGEVDSIVDQVPSFKYRYAVGGSTPSWLTLAEKMEGPPPTADDRATLDSLRRSADEVDMLGYSSGTTALPKLMLSTPNRWIMLAKSQSDAGKLGPDDVLLACAPAGGTWGLEAGHGIPLYTGAQVVLVAAFDAEDCLERSERHKVTAIMGVPAYYQRMLAHPRFAEFDLSSVRVCYANTTELPTELAKEIEARFGAPCIQSLGSSENGAIGHTTVDDPPEKRWTTVGRPIDHVRIRIVDENDRDVARGEVGELVCQSPEWFGGYLKLPELEAESFTPDYYLRNGDFVYMDADGYLVNKGRKKDMISRGGLKISPAEIEDLLYRHPAVAEAAVVAMPDSELGEKVCAFVVTRDAYDLTLSGVVEFMRGHSLASYKLPERLEIVPSLPRSPAQKILKRELRDRIAEQIRRETGAQG